MKIVIMSATLDPAIFREYYKEIDSDIPLIQIPGRTYPVDKDMDATDSYLARVCDEYRAGKSVIFFVPGKKEIDHHITKLREILGRDAQVFPLHAELPKNEQQYLLKRADGDTRPRIIVSTNVAEESITIDYLKVGVDLATQKVARYNELGVPGLYLEDTTDANCRQRAGRVGRTGP
jgi:HrpA-like RNA helicase